VKLLTAEMHKFSINLEAISKYQVPKGQRKARSIQWIQKISHATVQIDIACTMHLIDFNIFIQQMHNIFINNQLFLAALLHASISIHHPQGVSYYVC
jgi:hypothetical protein